MRLGMLARGRLCWTLMRRFLLLYLGYRAEAPALCRRFILLSMFGGRGVAGRIRRLVLITWWLLARMSGLALVTRVVGSGIIWILLMFLRRGRIREFVGVRY